MSPSSLGEGRKTEPNVRETKCMHIHGKRIPLLFLTLGEVVTAEAPKDAFKKKTEKKIYLVKWKVVHSNRLERGVLSG
ncbi:hypothetical protein POVCU2_0056810, partial [Plasmodium ovale curtisi]